MPMTAASQPLARGYTNGKVDYPLTLGRLETLWAWREEATSFLGDFQNGVAKHASPPLCLAHFEPGLLRWVFSGHDGDERLDDEQHPSLHYPAQFAEAQYDGCYALAAPGKRSGGPEAAFQRPTARAWPPALSDGASARRRRVQACFLG